MIKLRRDRLCVLHGASQTVREQSDELCWVLDACLPRAGEWSSSACRAANRAAAAVFNAANSTSSWAEPMCSIEREPRLQDQTICTAVAPQAVFTVRTKATSTAYGPALVFKVPANPIAKQQVNRSQPGQNPKREPSQSNQAV